MGGANYLEAGRDRCVLGDLFSASSELAVGWVPMCCVKSGLCICAEHLVGYRCGSGFMAYSKADCTSMFEQSCLLPQWIIGDLVRREACFFRDNDLLRALAARDFIQDLEVLANVVEETNRTRSRPLPLPTFDEAATVPLGGIESLRASEGISSVKV